MVGFVDFEKVLLNNEGMDLKEVFSKSNVIIFLLILVFSISIVFLLTKIYEVDIKEETTIEKQIGEMEGLKKQVGYTYPTPEEIQKQLNDLRNLRDARK